MTAFSCGLSPIIYYICSLKEYIKLNYMKTCLYLKIVRQICTEHLSYAVIHLQIDKKAMHKVGMVQRVQNEVKIHCQLKHPSILEVRTVGF